MSILETAQILNTRLPEFFEKLKEKYNYTDEELKTIVEQIDITGKNKVKKTVDQITCQGIMKSGARKGEKCGGKVKEGEFCSRHLKTEIANLESSREEKVEYEYTAKRNKHGRFEFGKTGLILDTKEEIVYVIGKQLDNGTIVNLSEEDKELCRRHRLKFAKQK